MIDQENAITVAVESSAAGERLQLVFEFHADDPEQLRQIGLDSGGGPGDDDFPTTDLSGDWNARKPKLDAYLVQLARDGLFSGAVLVADASGVQYEGVSGLASREFEVSNTLQTRFDIGSCTKDFTHVAVMQLRAAGKLKLEDKVGVHLPDYPNKDVRERVSIRQLVDHTSGLADYFDDDWFKTPMSALRTIDDYIPIWGPKPLQSEPGARTSYSNYGYTVLGAIIEKISGVDYPTYIEREIFRPLGMDRTGFCETDAVIKDVAVGYTFMSFEGRLDEAVKNIYVEPARGGPWGKTYSTVRDMYTFYDTLMKGGLLEGEDNWLAGHWKGGSIALAGGGPGLGAMVYIDGGRMVLTLANMDPPAAEKLAESLWQQLGD